MNNEQQLKDLQKTIDDAQNDLLTAQKQMQEIMDKKDDFEFSEGDYYVNGNGNMLKGISATPTRRNGNEFETREFAKYAAKMRKRQNIMLKAAERFNPEGWRPDWSNSATYKASFYFSYGYNEIRTEISPNSRNIESIYFDPNVATEAKAFIKYHMNKES